MEFMVQIIIESDNLSIKFKKCIHQLNEMIKHLHQNNQLCSEKYTYFGKILTDVANNTVFIQRPFIPTIRKSTWSDNEKSLSKYTSNSQISITV